MLHRGGSKLPETIPVEPDLGNTSVGKRDAKRRYL
jgi:hypothetical protein